MANPWVWFVNYYNRKFVFSMTRNSRDFWVTRKRWHEIAKKQNISYAHLRQLMNNVPLMAIRHAQTVQPGANAKTLTKFAKVSTIDQATAQGSGGYWYKLFNSAFRFSWYFFPIYAHHWVDHKETSHRKAELKLIGRQHGWHGGYKWLGGHWTKRTYPEHFGKRGLLGGMFWEY